MTTGRPQLTTDELRAREEQIIAANRRHDAKYGMAYDRFGWRTGFEPAPAKLDRESIWEHHRAIERQRLSQ